MGQAPLVDPSPLRYGDWRAVLQVPAQGLVQGFDLFVRQRVDRPQGMDACLPQRVLDVHVADARGTRLVQEKGLDSTTATGLQGAEVVEGQVHEPRPQLAHYGVLRRVGGIVGIAEPPVVVFTTDKAGLP